MNIIDETEEAIEEITQHPVARWDSAAVIPGPYAYESWGMPPHPIRDDYSYPNHLIPTEWSREDAMAVIDKTPPEVVRRARCCGTPENVASQLQPYIEAIPESNPAGSTSSTTPASSAAAASATRTPRSTTCSTRATTCGR